MKPIVQQLPLPPNCSFATGTFQVHHFKPIWYQHPAFELILCMEGNGRVSISNTEENYQSGDIFFLGPDIPYQFVANDNASTNGFIIHFTADSLGRDFFDLPECSPIKQVLELSKYGLRIIGNCCTRLSSLIQSLITAVNGNRIIRLLQCLQLIASQKDYIIINTSHKQKKLQTDNDFLNKIFKYTNDSFHNPVSLPKVAAVACMSVPSFCSYFKRYTHKTYFTYLNEIRIQYACHQLLQTNKSVTNISYESGFNTVAHFHRQFQRLKRTTPLQYRKNKTTIV